MRLHYFSVLLAQFLFIFFVSVIAPLSAPSHKRVALVIGIDDYATLSKLSNPVRDAKAVTALFRKHGIKVAEHLNLDHAEFEKALDDFARLAKGADEAIIFYAGHGMTAIRDKKLANVLAPIDANISCATRTAERTVTMARIVEAIKDVPKQVLLFDSCRNNPIRNCESNALTTTLQGFQPVRMAVPQARVSKPRGAGDDRAFVPVKLKGKTNTSSVLVAYSTDLGAAASDGDPGNHSPFAAALLAELNAGPSVPLRKILDQTSMRVANTAGQRPWVVTKGGEPDMCLRGRDCETSGALKAERLISESQRMAVLASQEMEKNRPVISMLLALEALPDKHSKKPQARTRPWVPEAEVALNTARDKNEEIVFLGEHKSEVTSTAFSPDGQHIVTSSYDQTARIWNAQTGELLLTIKGHKDQLASATFSPDGQRIVTASYDNTARIWDARTGKQLLVLKGHPQSVSHARFSPDGQRIVTASADSTARIWDARTGKQLLTLHVGMGTVWHANFSHDGRRIITTSENRTVHFWDAATGELIRQVEGHDEQIRTANFSPDDRHILTASDDNTARIWDIRTGNQLQIFKGHKSAVLSAVFSPDGLRVVTASDDGTTRIWNTKTGKPLFVLSGHGKTVYSAVFSPDGRHIVTASSDKSARIWDPGAKRLFRVLRGHKDNIISYDFSPDGHLIVTASRDKTARIWDTETGKQSRILKGHKKWVMSARFSSNGRRIFTAPLDGTLHIWDVKTGRLLHILEGHVSPVESAAYSPDSLRIVTSSVDRTARIWNARTGKQILVLKGHEDAVNNAIFSPNGRRIATTSFDETIRIWNADTGEQLHMFKEAGSQVDGEFFPNDVNSMAFSPDSQKLMTTTGKNVHIRDVETGEQLHILEVKETDLTEASAFKEASFSPDGRRVIATSGQYSGGIWNVSTGKLLHIIRGYKDYTRNTTFSYDRHRIGAGTTDYTLHIWDIKTGQPLVNEAKSNVSRCLTPKQRKQFQLPPEPPAWCYDMKKWPYHNGRPKPVAAK